jgi:predicted Ser/Thr protein kinase
MNDGDELAPTMAAHEPARVVPGSPSVPARYQPIEQIGRGGMGEVSLWRDERIGRELAAKVALPTLGEDGRRRFLREALLQARLEHPAFVPVYDVGEDERGEPYFTMRRIRGRTLRAAAQDVSRHRLLAAFGQLCLAVDYAHSRGVVHRDIKPDNVMLGDFGEVYLLDWGIAQIAGDDPLTTTAIAPSANATQHGSVLGTLGYMAPEQLRGENATLDGRADVYALGAVLFEILAGAPLHRGASAADLIASTLEANADPRPSARGAAVAPELDAICERALALDRDRRFPSARALAEAVEAFLEGDRDQALRRARAEELAQQANDTLARSAGDLALRIEAGRTAVRAVAFDPEHAGAREALTRALSEPIVRAPDAATEELETARHEQLVTTARSAAPLFLFFQIVLGAIWLWVGVREPWLVALALGAGALASVFAVAGARSGPASLERYLLASFLLLTLANMVVTRWISPWIAVPMITIANLQAFGMNARPRLRHLLVAVSIAAVLVPVALEAAGIVSPTTVWSEDGVRITSHMANMAPLWFLIVHFVMAAAGIGTTMFPALDRARAVELAARSQTWLLRQVLAAHRAPAPGPPASSR